MIATAPYDVVSQRRPLARPSALSLSAANPSASVEVMFIEEQAPFEQPSISDLDDSLAIEAVRRDDYAWIIQFSLGSKPLSGTKDVLLSWKNSDVKVSISSVVNSRFHPTQFLVDGSRKRQVLRVEVDSIPLSSKFSCVNKTDGTPVPIDLISDSKTNIVAIELRPETPVGQSASLLTLTVELEKGQKIMQEISLSSLGD